MRAIQDIFELALEHKVFVHGEVSHESSLLFLTKTALNNAIFVSFILILSLDHFEQKFRNQIACEQPHPVEVEQCEEVGLHVDVESGQESIVIDQWSHAKSEDCNV